MLYVLTTGSYSSYRILGIYDDKELAEKALKVVGTAGRLERHQLNPGAAPLTAGLLAWRVYFRENGEVDAYEHDEITENESVYRYGTGIDVCVLWAKDEASARKIAAEKRAEWLARKKGVA